ncbi:hypothetical protein [Rubrolithibacter danxiaensis]|uniref:hypothetical protein n=1 Tax=Rubrolithibacter danxiaensis TaxID=3390805 RepID=UPI003BF920D0
MLLKICTILLFLSSFLVAQESHAQYKAKRYNAIVRPLSGKRYKGILERVDEKGLTIRFHKTSKYFLADTVRKIRIKKYNAQNKSLLAGSILGLAGGLAAYTIQEDKGNTSPIILPVVIVSSALSGAALVGTINSFTAVKTYKNVNKLESFKPVSLELRKYSLSKL